MTHTSVDHKIEAAQGTGDSGCLVKCACGWKAESDKSSVVAAAALGHAEAHGASSEAMNWASALIDFQIDDLEDGLITEADLW